jgi:hypothetical protein
MCAINPKHQKRFLLTVYTAHKMDDLEFLNLVLAKALDAEIALNADGRLRWHLEALLGGNSSLEIVERFEEDSHD